MREDTDQVPDADDAPEPQVEPTRSQLWADVMAEQKGTARQGDDPNPDQGDAGDGQPDDDPLDDDPDDYDDDDVLDDQDDDDDVDDDRRNVAPKADADEISKQIERLEHQIASDEGRINAHRSRVNERQAELKRAKARLERLKTDTDEAKARRERIAEIGDEYGDALKPFAEELTATGSRLDALVEDETQRIKELETDAETTRREQEAIFLKEHPDAPEIFKEHRDVFAAWIEDQPKKLRDIAARNKTITDGVEASLLMSHFKRALAQAEDQTSGKPQQSDPRRESQKRGARTTKPTPGRRATTEPDPMSDDRKSHWEWAKRQIAKTKAKA